MNSGRAKSPTSFGLRVGVDLVHVDAVAQSVEAFGRRYLERVFSPGELSDCSTPGGWAVERLAARFAAKEAVIKALRPQGGIDHRTISLRGDADGAAEIVLDGSIAAHAAELGVGDSSISISHDGDYASAVFVALASSQAETAEPDSVAATTSTEWSEL